MAGGTEDLARVARHCRGVASSSRLDDVYTDDEREFAVAMEAYRRGQRRPFPTCREVLAVLRSLCYRKQAAEKEPPPRAGRSGRAARAGLARPGRGGGAFT
jgi:hypothetical protein